MKKRTDIQQLRSEINKALGRLNETAQETNDKKVFKVEWKGEEQCILTCDGTTIETLDPEQMLQKIWEKEEEMMNNK